jgi:hypothetical protein
MHLTCIIRMGTWDRHKIDAILFILCQLSFSSRYMHSYSIPIRHGGGLANLSNTALDLADSSRLEVTPSDFTKRSRVESSRLFNQVDLASRDSTFRVLTTLLYSIVRVSY